MWDKYHPREIGQMVKSDEADIEGEYYGRGYGIILARLRYEEDPKFVELINQEVDQVVCPISNTCTPIVLVQWSCSGSSRWMPANYCTPVTQPFEKSA